ncbi:LexA family protein [Legionella spiritensis]|uniref:LexA family protein n=1 Tax=Legionella spiritensis TaxID=452 RepID=UPI000F6D26C4|nr:translesion error-prone DNA polymerase V autoproteolytic subunit [Legionella spiritensis]VEG90241.1 SOS (error prone) mutagenesis protein UmuD (RumA) [Legionella spiritensis]
MSHGGRRAGAGRPRGQGKYGETTKSIRIPLSRVSEVRAFLDSGQASNKLPLYSSTVRAGFPSPADDYIETYLDLNQHLVKHPAATFFVVASGDSMIGAGIASGDMLIVDRSLEPVHGKIVIAAINGELTVKRLSHQDGRMRLMPENKHYKPIDITEDLDMVIWGVVTHVIHRTG